jgi:hypothetical protein
MRNGGGKKIFLIICIIIGLVLLLALVILFYVRLFSERQIDDVSPEIPCNEKLLEKVDVFYVIPKMNDKNISENKQWCETILKMNKKLAMHGIRHNYREFLHPMNESDLIQGEQIFENCFGFMPDRFKAPHLSLSWKNKQILKKTMKVDGYWNQLTHKVYHCGNSGRFSNKFIDFF